MHRIHADSRPPASEAGDVPADETERHKRKRMQNWKGKAEVLEQVNELIAELDTISSSIASQVGIDKPNFRALHARGLIPNHKDFLPSD